MTRGNETNNYAEAGIRVLKEIVFGRMKAYIFFKCSNSLQPQWRFTTAPDYLTLHTAGTDLEYF